MKSLVFIAVLVASQIASASWYQEYCANVDGSLQIAGGHTESYLKVAYTKKDGSEAYRHLDYSEVNQEWTVLKEATESTNTCDENSEPGAGYGMWTTISEVAVVLTKVDGSSFPASFKGVSEDGRSISTTVMCEANGNSMVACGGE